MAVYKKFKNEFTQVPNKILNNPKLSFKAKGIWAYLASKPNGWGYSVKGSTLQSKDGYEAISSGMKELEKQGYLKRVPSREKGSFNGSDYHIYDEAKTVNGLTANVKPVNGEHTNHSNTILSNKEEVILKQESIPKNSKKEFSEDVELTYSKIEILFNGIYHPENQKTSSKKLQVAEKWKECIEKLNRIDGHTFEEIVDVITKTKKDNFWSDKFVSILKAREKNKLGVLWFDDWKNKFRNTSSSTDNFIIN